ncbi:hypothetical protein AB0B28_01010 [Glycomyces sp. NPDC046736]|uniref:hypothetical protein n=1 Tax=Glycomyces sp. NPDC046736 TaxID=3155615 RepID=UPI0033DAB362
MYPPPAETEIKVRYSTGYSITVVVLGSLILATVIIALLAGTSLVNVNLFLGPLFLLIGILSFSKPICSYEPATGTFRMHALLGPVVRTYGAPKGERLWFDGNKIVRVLPSGKQKRVWLTGSNAGDKARLIQVVTAQQQAPQQPR